MANSAGCVIKNNYSFGNVKDINVTSEHSSKFNEIENNPSYPKYTGPEIFENPAHGNYSIRDDAGIDIYVPFELIGRY